MRADDTAAGFAVDQTAPDDHMTGKRFDRESSSEIFELELAACAADPRAVAIGAASSLVRPPSRVAGSPISSCDESLRRRKLPPRPGANSSAAAEEKRGAEQEAEVVPSAGVVNLIDADSVGEQ